MSIYLWPLLLIVGSNVVYHLAAKGTPAGANPFFSLIITYLVGAVLASVMFLVTASNRSLSVNFSSINWSSFFLGLSIVGLEAGNIYLYRAGCPISLGSLIANIALAVILLVVGILFFREAISLNQCIGILCCLVGLVFINLK